MTLGPAELLAVAAALGWASGLRLYAVLFLTGLAGQLGWVPLPSGLALLAEPWMLGLSGALFVTEFLVDKVPWLDSAWDVVHTAIRIPGGAALAAAALGGDSAQWSMAAALLGGTLAATSHAAKTTARAAANASPEPFSNWGLSLLDDLAVPFMLWLSWEHPAAFFAVLAVALVAMVGVIVLLWRAVRGVVRHLQARTRPAAIAPSSR